MLNLRRISITPSCHTRSNTSFEVYKKLWKSVFWSVLDFSLRILRLKRFAPLSCSLSLSYLFFCNDCSCLWGWVYQGSLSGLTDQTNCTVVATGLEVSFFGSGIMIDLDHADGHAPTGHTFIAELCVCLNSGLPNLLEQLCSTTSIPGDFPSFKLLTASSTSNWTIGWSSSSLATDRLQLI